MKPTELQFAAYQKMFDYFNEKLFENQLGGVILNFSRKAKTHGFFAPERWENGEKVATHEISLNPQTLAREPEAVISTLVQEMVHLWQQDFGTPPRRNYHNKEWADKMEQIGLIPSDTGEPGGKRTGQNMTHYVDVGGAFYKAYHSMPEDYLLPFKANEPGEKAKKPKRKDKVKYTCPNCDTNAWGKTGLHIICQPCNVLMMEAGQEPEAIQPHEDLHKRLLNDLDNISRLSTAGIISGEIELRYSVNYRELDEAMYCITRYERTKHIFQVNGVSVYVLPD